MLSLFDVGLAGNRRRLRHSFCPYAIRRQMIPSERNCYREGAALSERAGHIDRSAMKPGQFSHQRQPNSSALKCSRSRTLDAMETLENARKLFFGDAGARVGHGKLYTVSDDAEANYDATLKGEFEGIGEKIQYDLLPHVTVHIHGFCNGLAFDREGQSRFLHRRSKDAAHLSCELAQFGRLVDRFEAPGFEAREVEK